MSADEAMRLLEAARRDREYTASQTAAAVNLANRVTQQDALIKELVGALEAIALLDSEKKADALGLIKRARHIAKCSLAAAKEAQS